MTFRHTSCFQLQPNPNWRLIGELTAATVAEMMSLEEAGGLVATRARAMYAAEPGTMTAIMASEATVGDLLGNGIELAAINGAESVVLAGTHEAVIRLRLTLEERQIAGRELRTSHAFHTASMDEAAAQVVTAAESIDSWLITREPLSRSARRPPLSG